MDHWTAAAAITEGRLFRCVNRFGTVWGERVTEKVIWHAVRKYGKAVGMPRLAPHDCRRTCARLCQQAANWNRSSSCSATSRSKTTERYLGCKQRLRDAVNDKIGLEA